MIWAQHISGIHNNTIADMESCRTYFKNQWQLNRRWGPFEIDLFVDRTANLLQKYVSWFLNPDAFHTNAFLILWKTLPRTEDPIHYPSGILLLAQCNLGPSALKNSYFQSFVSTSSSNLNDVFKNAPSAP